jgi:hypothetical protein
MDSLGGLEECRCSGGEGRIFKVVGVCHDLGGDFSVVDVEAVGQSRSLVEGLIEAISRQAPDFSISAHFPSLPALCGDTHQSYLTRVDAGREQIARPARQQDNRPGLGAPCAEGFDPAASWSGGHRRRHPSSIFPNGRRILHHKSVQFV